jgi:hypothetical protein
MNGSLYKLTILLTRSRLIILGYFVLITVLGSCQNNNNVQAIPSNVNGDLLAIRDSTFKSGTGWGYKVYVGDNIYINQPFIPGVPGKRYFVTEDDAKKVAALVVKKIMQHHLPPTVSGNELRQLHIIE